MRILLMIFIQMSAVTVGDLLLSKGMKSLGPVPLNRASEVFSYALRVFSCPYIGLGIVFLALSFFLWIAVLSRADLSYALPITAMGYVLNAFAAKMFLHEHISVARWIGTLVICFGVAIITYTPER